MFCTRGHAFHLLVVLSYIKIKYKFSVSFLKNKLVSGILCSGCSTGRVIDLYFHFLLVCSQNTSNAVSNLNMDRSIFFINLLAKKPQNIFQEIAPLNME